MRVRNVRWDVIATIGLLVLIGNAGAGIQGQTASWTAQDIGNPAIAGSATSTASGFTITAGGIDIGGTSDQMHFVYQPVTGDVDVSARVDSLTNSSPWAKAGVMIRGSLAPNAAHGYALVSPGRGTAFQRRLQAGGSSPRTLGVDAASPEWVRLIRRGDTFSAYTSPDGASWSLITSRTIQLGATAYVGLAVTSDDAATATTAVLSQISVTPLLPEGQQAADIGSPALAGSTSYVNGTYQIHAGGADIWGTSDQFHFVYQQASGDLDLRLRVDSMTLSASWAKAGVMIRETLTAGSNHAYAALSANQGFAFHRRPVANSTTASTSGSMRVAPAWVRLTRSGTLFTAYESIDGQNWSSIASDSITMADTVYVGIAVTSQNTTTATDVVADAFTVTQTGSGNQPPTVSMSSPADNATFTAPASITMTANAADAENQLTEVEFFNGTTLLGMDTAAPYSFTWSSAPAGAYSLTARAYDAGGLSTTSAPVNITVMPANQPPTVSITSPANNATFTAPASITMAATAADPENQLARVEFYNGTTLLGTDTAAPHAFTWSSAPAGAYSLTAKAYDAGGLSTTSAPVSITVTGANQPPTVSITSPANNATFTAPASITMTATAADPENQLARVEFYNGTTLLGTDTAAPYAFTWSSVPAGAYSLTARGYDAGGLSTTSAPVSITVTGANQPPTVSITSPANNATFTAPASITMTATAADPENQLARVEFYNGTTLLGTDTAAPYAFTWSSAPAGAYSLTARAYDAGGLNTTSAAVSITVTGANQLPAGQQAADIGSPALAGSTSYANGTYQIHAGGADIWGTSDQFHFVYQQASGDLDLRLRVDSMTLSASWAKAGVMIRETLTAGSNHAYAALSANQGFAFHRRLVANSTTASTSGSMRVAPAWVRLTRSGTLFTAYESVDGQNWSPIASHSITMADTVYVGIAVTSQNTTTATDVDADGLTITQGAPGNQPPTASITSPANNATFTAPASITMTATAADPENQLTRVEFYNGTTLLGTDTAAPYAFTWSSAPAGAYSLTARAYDAGGLSTTSAPVSITVTGANQPPTASITSPANNATFTAPASITMTATAADPENQLTRVEFYNGTTLLGTDTAAPYAFTWSSAPAGAYSLTARAYDAGGLSTTSAPVSITVTGANQPPTVSITSPANNATFTAPASITMTATAADPENQLTRVEFYRGTTLLGTDTGAPYAFTWSSAPAGAYSLTARAYDAGGLSTTSAPVSITVTGANQPPTVSITSPANNATFTAPASITMTATAADPENQLTRVEFYNGTTLLGTDTAAPYAFTWSSAPAGAYSLTARAYDAGGLSTTSAAVNVTVNGTSPPTGVIFAASTDHAVVTSYRLDVFAAGVDPNTATPVSSLNVGKPTPAGNNDITVSAASFFSALAPGTYQLTVSAIGSAGIGRSAPLSFTR